MWSSMPILRQAIRSLLRSLNIKVYQGALIGIDCGSGSHQVHLTFTPPGMKTGAMVSCAGIVGLIALAVTDHIKPKKKVPVTK